ncbi:helix-turn-helix domain-containing protein [Nocardia sp. NPDC127579]|uniref:helix-turn-helix domain-containing protein n=1 Tax=Nocardia sp. NPDC127579 TaxID=3345402 RepID=UPI0036359B6F
MEKTTDQTNDSQSDLALVRSHATVSVETAGRLLGISRAHAYELARSGALPTVPLGERRKRVPSAALRRMLGLE